MKLCSHSIATALVGFFFCACAFVTSARSQTCNFSVTNVAFGTVDVTANAAVDTVATVSVTCSALVSVALRVCVNLGIGSGGATNAANRFMKSGANALTYGLFSDSARTIPWGSNFWAGGAASPVLVDFPLFIGTSTQTRTLYGRVYSGQQTVPTGSYLSSFSSTDAEIQYGLLSLVTCNLLTNTSTTSFNVTATVPTTCTVAANNLNFGTAGVLTANTDATTTLSPKCTSGTPYNIGLDKGVNGGSVTTRQMKAGGPALINYSLFRDASRTMNWGQTIGHGHGRRHRHGTRPISDGLWPDPAAADALPRHLQRHDRGDPHLLTYRDAFAAGMREEEIVDIDSSRARWEIPAHRSKNGHAHVIPLSVLAMQLITAAMAMPARKSPFVFASPAVKGAPITAHALAAAMQRMSDRITAEIHHSFRDRAGTSPDRGVARLDPRQ